MNEKKKKLSLLLGAMPDLLDADDDDLRIRIPSARSPGRSEGRARARPVLRVRPGASALRGRSRRRGPGRRGGRARRGGGGEGLVGRFRAFVVAHCLFFLRRRRFGRCRIRRLRRGALRDDEPLAS